MSEEFNLKYISNRLNHVAIVCKSGETQAHFANDLAVECYGDEHGVVDVKKFLERSTTHSFLIPTLKAELQKNDFYATSEVGFRINSGDEIISDLQITYTNESKKEFFILLVQQNDKRLEIAKSQVDTSYRAEAILEFNENLTIYYCNSAFYTMLGGKMTVV